MYEMEDGHSPQGRDVRYGYNQDIFPNYSWRGYAIMSRIQVGTYYELIEAWTKWT